MPIINIHLTKPEPSKKMQDKIAQEITEIFVENLGKNPQRVVVQFQYDEAEKFYFGGESVADMRKKTTKKEN